MAQTLVREHGGQVPADMDALTALPGVGRKTANVVLGHALGVPGLPVDRHVLRVANRIGIAEGDDPVRSRRSCARAAAGRCGRSPRTCRSCTAAASAGPKPLCDAVLGARRLRLLRGAPARVALARRATRRAQKTAPKPFDAARNGENTR